MAYSDASFSKQLDQVKNQFQDLSTTLEKVCKNLKDPGSPPPSEILKEINSAIENFEELKSYVTEWAQYIQMPNTETHELDSIKTITTFSKNIVAHQDNVQQDEKVLGDINRARLIQYAQEGESFPPLEDFHRKLDKLENRVSTSPISDEGQKDRTQILDNKHPINYLFTLLELGDELDHESRGQALDIISKEYGPAFMGAAAFPGSLILREIPVPEGPQPPDVEEESEEPEQERTDDLSVDGQAEVQQEEILEEPPTTTTEKEPDKSGSESADDLPVGGKAPIEVEAKKEKTESKDVSDKDGITELKEEIDHDLPDKEVPAELGFCFNASETAQSIASSLKSADYTFERGFPDLFWALIRENRLDLAYWLARYVEIKELDLPFTLPSYFVEALIHGLAVQNNTGSSAGCLADIYNREKFELLESEEAGYKESIRLLIVCGSLRPSLFAPHTGAHTYLKSLTPLPGLDAFFAIGQAVEKFATQGLPIITDNLTDAKDDQEWQKKLDILIEEARGWLEHAPSMSMRNNILNRIWRDYVKEGNLVYNLVSPVAEDKGQQIEVVKTMISKLNNIQTFAQEEATQAAGKRFNYRPLSGLSNKFIYIIIVSFQLVTGLGIGKGPRHAPLLLITALCPS